LFSCDRRSVLEKDEVRQEKSVNTTKSKSRWDRSGDIPLGASLASLDLEKYESYGEFVDNHFLDFYYVDNPTCPPLGIHSKQLMLYFSDGLLIRKRYMFENDVIADIENKFLKNTHYSVPDGMKQLNLKFKTKQLSYVRSSGFFLYESRK
jgi:hypothetical protein